MKKIVPLTVLDILKKILGHVMCHFGPFGKKVVPLITLSNSKIAENFLFFAFGVIIDTRGYNRFVGKTFFARFYQISGAISRGLAHFSCNAI